ncbi:MAG: tRNA uridine-5-carboxymethylaminomethyl(34) synthesis GTPase MnmE [Proteobacteria bacterium]|nr:tRNA uridine-5-carboxymethylaminomethyl(34) synthesis GTPase MnmE [Pseudomonadota bacterium]
MYTPTDTIAAIATAKGAAALGIIRISGPEAGPILDLVVPGARAPSKPRRVFAATARDPRSGTPIDEVLCFYCAAPGTSTGENTAEIHGHGGPIVMKKLLDATLEAGARAAQPGEFTYRAFQNQRLDLTQAEAVMGLIGAQSERAAHVAFRQLDGELGRILESQFDALIAVSAQIEAGLDFPDEDLPISEAEELASRLVQVSDRLQKLHSSFALGARITEGARVAIIGPPNAGKSSLLNRLVGEDRALVDVNPGTTRDVVEARGEAEGIPLVFLDTAGLRKKAQRIEQRGIEKTLETARKADLILLVLDGANRNKTSSDALSYLPALTSQNLLLAINKSDLPSWRNPTDLPFAEDISPPPRVPISALTGDGIPSLTKTIAQRLGNDDDESSVMLTTARQATAVASCREHVVTATELLKNRSELELAAADLRLAREQLAALWGREATEDMLDAIFSTFCLGK